MSIIHLVNFMILDLVWRVVMFIMGYAQTSLCYVQASRIELGDNCIQNFPLGRYIVGYTVGNLVRVTCERSRKT